MLIWDKLNMYNEGNLSYTDQVALFFEIYPGKRSALEGIFRTNDQFSRARLKKGFDEKFQELEALKKENSYKSFVKSVHAENKIDLERLPEDLRTLAGELGPIIREISASQVALRFGETKDELYPIAKRIMELVRRRRYILTLIDDFQTSGNYGAQQKVTIEKVDPNKLKNFEVEHKMSLIRSRISKAKKKNDLTKTAFLEKELKELSDKRYV